MGKIMKLLSGRVILVRLGVLVCLGWMLTAACASADYYKIQRIYHDGETFTIHLPKNEEIVGVRVMLRRMNPQFPNTSIQVGFDDGTFLENGAYRQIDQEVYVNAMYAGGGASTRGRKLKVYIHGGDIDVRQVDIDYYEGNRGRH